MEKPFNLETIEDCIKRLKTAIRQKKRFISESECDTIRNNYQRLAYPDHPNWSYCIPLVPNVEIIKGEIVDLGIHIYKWGKISANIVYSNDGPDYASGDCFWTSDPAYKQLALVCNRYGLLSDKELIMQFANHNGLWKEFYRNPTCSIWDIHSLIIKQG